MAGLGLMNRRRAIASSPIAGITMEDYLIGKYNFIGRSNDDPDRGIVQDLSGRGNPMTLSFNNWGKGDAYTTTGYYDDCLCSFPGSNYATIPLTEPMSDNFTIIIERAFYSGGLANYSALLGSNSSLSSSKSTIFLEYIDAGYEGGGYSCVLGAKVHFGRTNGNGIAWLTPFGYNGYMNDDFVPTETSYATKLIIGKLRDSVFYYQRFKIKSIHIFNRVFGAQEIEEYIKKNIDANYTLTEE